MLVARSRTKVMGFLLGEEASQCRSRDFTDRMPGEDDGQGAEFDVEEGLRGHQARSHNKRLGDGGVLDGLLVRGGSVGRQVQARDFTQGGQMACYRRQFQPGGQKTRGL
jgi:hypothetical protein